VEKRRFLRALKHSGNVTEAAQAAGRPRNAFYVLRSRDSWFARRWYESVNYYIEGGLSDPAQRREAERAAIAFARTLKSQLAKYQPNEL